MMRQRSQARTRKSENGKELSGKFLATRKELAYEISGLSPILMNNGAAILEERVPGGVPSPELEAERGVYKLTSGQLYLPGAAFRRAILTACKGKKLGRQGAAGIVSASLQLVDTECPLFDGKNREIREYEIDIRRCVPPRQGAVRRARPLIRDWKCQLHVELYEVSTTHAILVPIVDELIAQAGLLVGVGNYRPQLGGSYGRFRVRKL